MRLGRRDDDRNLRTWDWRSPLATMRTTSRRLMRRHTLQKSARRSRFSSTVVPLASIMSTVRTTIESHSVEATAGYQYCTFSFSPADVNQWVVVDVADLAYYEYLDELGIEYSTVLTWNVGHNPRGICAFLQPLCSSVFYRNSTARHLASMV